MAASQLCDGIGGDAHVRVSYAELWRREHDDAVAQHGAASGVYGAHGFRSASRSHVD